MSLWTEVHPLPAVHSIKEVPYVAFNSACAVVGMSLGHSYIKGARVF